MMNEVMRFKKELTPEEFNINPFTKAKGLECATIAYSLWHLFRIEDIVC